MIEGRHISGILKPFEPGFARTIAEADEAIEEPSSDVPGDERLGEGTTGGEEIGDGEKGRDCPFTCM